MFQDLQIWFSDSWQFYQRHLIALLAVSFPVLLPLEFFGLFMELRFSESMSSVDYFFANAAPSLLVHPLYQCAVFLFIQQALKGNIYPVKTYYSKALSYWGKLFLLYLFLAVTVGFGLMLLVLPGIYFMMRTLLAEPEAIFGDKGVIDAISDSWATTEKSQGMLILGMGVIYGISLLPFGLVQLMNIETIGANFIASLVSSCLVLWLTVFQYRVYLFIKPQENT